MGVFGLPHRSWEEFCEDVSRTEPPISVSCAAVLSEDKWSPSPYHPGTADQLRAASRQTVRDDDVKAPRQHHP